MATRRARTTRSPKAVVEFEGGGPRGRRRHRGADGRAGAGGARRTQGWRGRPGRRERRRRSERFARGSGRPEARGASDARPNGSAREPIPCQPPAPRVSTRFRPHPHIGRSPRMARVTVEDCIDKVDNRFELVLLASHRARMISSGRAAHHRSRPRQEPGRRPARGRRRDRAPGRPARAADPLLCR